MGPIRNAIRYINEEYGMILVIVGGFYKRACEDGNSRSKLKKYEVKKVLDRFKEDLSLL